MIESNDKLPHNKKFPYECILIDGPWGVGKSYAIKAALADNDNVCNISMFGLKDAQEIYHELFFQLEKKTLKDFLSKALDVGAAISDKVATVKGTMALLIKEKELFFHKTEEFNQVHFLIIDDLERTNDNIKLEEVFGIIDELKRCENVKVIAVANTKEISPEERKEQFDRYSEKVIDRSYYITERPGKIEWENLKIDSDFITEFLNKHDVKNLRTLQKAQNFYDDVRLRLQDEYCDEFYDEIRWTCYAIVVESIDNLYRRAFNNVQDGAAEVIQTSNLTGTIDYYLQGARISKNMVRILQKYYANETEIIADEIDVEYEIFIQAGEKANYYKADEELKQVLPDLSKKIMHEASIVGVLRYADEYFIWSEHLKIDNSQLKHEYKTRLGSMFYDEAMKGNVEYLIYGIETLDVQSQTNINIIRDAKKAAKIKVVDEYIRYLSETTHGEQAYEYSYILRKFVDNEFLKDINIDALYNEKSFPIRDVTEQQYYTAYNIMCVLYSENKNRFLNYCKDVQAKCDNMAAHRINVLLEQITGKK